MQPENNFGPLASEYKSARRGYPTKIYSHLKVLLQKENPTTLDLGCGTGISTRELGEHGFRVIGADKDADMIAVAQERESEISYVVASAEQLPFPNNHFDAVTAFTAFHWFNNEESLNEVRRVLKTKGLFFAALKGNQETEEAKKFNEGYQTILKKYAGAKFDSTHKHFNKENLKELFKDVSEKSFPIDEKYTIDNALVLIQSLSLWNLVPEDKKQDLLDEMKMFYTSQLVDGFIIRKRQIFTVSALKK